jgi:hypothetical protein
LSTGLVDEVIDPDNLLQAAVAAAERFISGEFSLSGRRTRFKHDRLPGASELREIAGNAKSAAVTRAKWDVARVKAIEAIGKGLSSNIEADIDREIDLFCDCALSDVAKDSKTFLTRSGRALPG